MELKRDITKSTLLLLALSGIIGSGWLFGPYYAAKIAGPAAIYSWLIGFVMISIIALPFSEMASRFPKAGGIVHFARMSHGFGLSFIVSFANWLAFVTIAPIEVQASLQYSSHFLPYLIHLTPTGDKALTHQGLLAAGVLMLFFTVVNLFGIKLAAKVNAGIAIWKLVVPAILLIVMTTLRFKVTNFTTFTFMPYGWKGVFSAVATGGVVFSYIGFRHVVELAAEVKNPARSIPFALLGALVITAVFYLLLQCAFVGAVAPENILHGWHHLSFEHQGGPLLDLVASIGVIWMIFLLYLDSVISPLGAGVISTTSTARVLYAMGTHRFVPTLLTKLNNARVPAAALWLNFIVGMLFFLPFSGWQQMITIMVDCAIIAYLAGAACVMPLRNIPQTANSTRTFKQPGGHLVSWLSFTFGTLILYWSGWGTIWHLAAALCIGLVVLMLLRLMTRFKSREESDFSGKGFLWFVIYFMGVMCISYLGDFGGHAVIDAYTAFFALSLWGLCAYIGSQYSRIDGCSVPA